MTFEIDVDDFQSLEKLARSRGLTVEQMFWVAVHEYVEKSERMKGSGQQLYGQGVGRALWMSGVPWPGPPMR